MGDCFSRREPIDFDGPVHFTHFEILRAIGKGAFGKVCIVKKKDSKEMYAMKYMDKIQIIQKRAVDNVFREITILKSLEHPFLVNLWFAFHDAEDIFVVLDLMLGGDISYHLEKEGRFTVPRVQLYMAECCLALDYLKSQNIIHRDIKPANMLLDSKGHLHLTDFNVACIVREGKVVTSMTGTRPYMAPEIIKARGGRGYNYAVDWWSLGVSAYEMLRGERPYAIHQNMTNEEMYTLLTKVRPPASARWDDSTCNILKVLLHPDPTKRLASLEQVKPHSFFSHLDWDQVLNLETLPPYVPSQNRIHCDPTHELEEMIVEPNPLHKKKSRLSKRHKNSFDDKLTTELEKMDTRFRDYNRIRENLATALESSHIESHNETEDDPPPDTPPSPITVRGERGATSISLPKQDSPLSTQIDEEEGEEEERRGTVSPLAITAEVHIPSSNQKAIRQDSTASTEPLLGRSPVTNDNEAESSPIKQDSTDGGEDKGINVPNGIKLEKVSEEVVPLEPELEIPAELGSQDEKGEENSSKIEEEEGKNGAEPKTELMILDTRTDQVVS